MSLDTSSLKPVAMGAIAGAIDQFYLGETDMMRTVYFAGAVAVGSYAAEFASPLVKDIAGFIPSINKSIYDSKTLAERIVEIGGATGSAYFLNKYVLGNDPYKGELMKRVAVIAVSDVLATYALEYFQGKSLEFLKE